MSQWIAEDPIHVVVRNEQDAIYDTHGRLVQPKQRRVYAKFERGTAPAWAVDLARQADLQFRAMPERGVTVQQWLSYYDVKQDQLRNGWTDEEVEEIVRRVDEVAHAAIRCEPPRLKAPWPAYDKLVAQGQRTIDKVAAKIAEKVQEDGYSPHEVVAYERQNLNREQVIAALEALLEPVEEATETIVAA